MRNPSSGDAPTLSSTQSLLQTESEFHLSYDAAVPCVVMIWRGYHTTASFREKNEQVLALIADKRATRILCDIREFLLIGATDQVWLTGDWLPRAMAAGLRHCAIVTPVYFFNQVAVRTVAEQIDAQILRVDHFESAEEARLWLQRMHVAPISAPSSSPTSSHNVPHPFSTRR